MEHQSPEELINDIAESLGISREWAESFAAKMWVEELTQGDEPSPFDR